MPTWQLLVVANLGSRGTSRLPFFRMGHHLGRDQQQHEPPARNRKGGVRLPSAVDQAGQILDVLVAGGGQLILGHPGAGRGRSCRSPGSPASSSLRR